MRWLPRNPLFTTYSQPENRVTASMVAVFERLGLDTLEELLWRATGEASLSFVSFSNQVAGPESVPDAAISSSFQYLFEIKVVRNALRESQLRGHLAAFDTRFREQRRLISARCSSWRWCWSRSSTICSTPS
jgi:hypothetical protein